VEPLSPPQERSSSEESARVSIVIPLHNEECNVRPLVESIRKSMGPMEWELLLVDDGSKDASFQICEELANEDPRIRPLRLARNYGQTAAMNAGFDHANGAIVVTLDGDLQNDPRDIPRLVEKLDEGYDLVTGYRENRQDRAVTRKLPSWIANRLIRRISGVDIRDTGCSLRAYRAEVVRRMVLYSDMHRFIPAMAAAVAGARIAEIPVRHHPRRYGESKYGLSRTWRVVLDLLTLAMIRSFRDRPLLMFGLVAGGVLILGFGFTLATLIGVEAFRPVKAQALVFPGTAALMYGLTLYLLMLGLVGEVIVRQHLTRSPRSSPVVHEVA